MKFYTCKLSIYKTVKMFSFDFDIDFDFGFGANNEESDFVNFVIIRPNSNNMKISIHKEHTLWDLYELSYYTIYPTVDIHPTVDNPTEQSTLSNTDECAHDSSNYESQVIYDIFVSDDTQDNNIKSIPVNKLVKIKEFIHDSPEFFNKNKKSYKLFVVDESILQEHFYPEKKESFMTTYKNYMSKLWMFIHNKQYITPKRVSIF